MINQIRISYSSMKDFWECQKRYFYRITRAKLAVANVHMIFGRIVHDSIERLEKKARPLNKLVGWSLHEWERQMASAANFLGDKAPRPPKSFKRMYENYIHIIRPKLSNENVIVEHFFKIPLMSSPDGKCNIFFTGKIDRIDDKGIYDWKTAGKLPDTYDLHDTQFFAYWWAYQKLFKSNPKGLVYGHLGSGNLYNISMSISLLENFEVLLDKTAEVVYNSWKAEEFPRVVGYQCKKCTFRNICFKELVEEENVENS